MAWARQCDAWDRAALLAHVWSGEPIANFTPFDERGRPKRADAPHGDPTVLEYDPALMQQIASGGKFRW